MRATLAAVSVLVFGLPVSSGAHRLDEYLQASRLALSSEGLIVELDLTPGVDVAPAIAALLDRNADRLVSPREAEAYGRLALQDLVVEFNGGRVPLALTRVDVPLIVEMEDGVGTIQLRFAGDVRLTHGQLQHLYFRNNHLPERSVYLVNALVPEDTDLRIAGQSRDRQQRETRLTYVVRDENPVELAWLVVALVGLASLARWRLRNPGTMRAEPGT